MPKRPMSHYTQCHCTQLILFDLFVQKSDYKLALAISSMLYQTYSDTLISFSGMIVSDQDQILRPLKHALVPRGTTKCTS